MTVARIYIYNSGYNEDRWNEGPSGFIVGTGDATFTFTKEPTYLSLIESGTNYEFASIVSGPYNVDYYDSVSINWAYGANGDGLSTNAIFSVDPDPFARVGDYHSSITKVLSSSGASIDTIDLSVMSGEFYLFVTISTNGKPLSSYAYTNQVYFSGDIPAASSSVALGDFLLSGGGLMTGATGCVVSNLDSCYLNGLGGSNSENYGYLPTGISLDSVGTDLYGYTSIKGSGVNTLDDVRLISFGGKNNNGALNTSISPLGLNLTASGGDYSSKSGYVDFALSGLTTVSSGESSGIARYSTEWRKFSGKSCITLEKEYSYSSTKPASDCFSMVTANPISINRYSNLTIYTDECACSINVPIYLNREHSEDVDLLITTVQPTISIDASGNADPALNGVDYTHNSGEYTVPSGSLYTNFPVTLLGGSTVRNYFQVKVFTNTSRNICSTSLPTTYNIIIEPT